jgi:hypothetical protein
MPVVMPNKYYHFKGKSEEIINSILSLLLGKEYYKEVSYYSDFINETQSAQYRKKLHKILDFMQKENLILIREIKPEDSGSKIKDGDSRVYLRQHGKQVLTEGGYKPGK